jgi:hypothetical protein
MVGLVAVRGGSAKSPDGFELVYVGLDGRERREPLQAVTGSAFEQVPPVRSFAAYRGQRNNTGLWWSVTTGSHVGYESWLERDHLTLLDFDPTVVGVASQPFWLFWTAEDGRRRSHAPDFFARRRDGSGLVIDVRPVKRVRPRDSAAFEATRRACAVVGWDFRLVHEPEPVRMANVRWLAGYRHPRCLNAGLAETARTVFLNGMPLMDGAEALGDTLGTLPTVFHLLWSGELRTDLELPLSRTSLVTTAVAQ